ncbi:MAG TPA: Ig-like domain-containing protein [Sphingopyxis sp.]|nr:Ig-like domain-containing protein [Sphingopyxis sp.]
MKAEIIEKKNGSRRQTEDARNIVLDRPSVVFLKLAPENVARYERRGDDLVLVMKDGQELLIQGFFIKFAGDDAIDSDARTDVADNGSTEELTRSELVLEDENGVVWWGQYPEQWTEFHFTEIEWDDAAAAVWWPYLLGALGVAGAGVAIAGGSKKNKPPVAINDEGRGEEDGGPVTGNVIGNDNDPDGDPLTVTDFTVEGTTYKPGETAEIPGVGTIVINTDGSYTFTPEPDYNGTVPTITYTISDGKGGSDKADLVITIDPVNDAPVPEGEIEDQSSKDADTDTDLDASGFFKDVDGDDLTYSATGLPEGLTIDPVTGIISGTIDKSASQGGHDGVYSVTITATDPDGESATQTFTWTVTNPEPIAEDDTATTAEDTPVSGNVLGNDSDPDGDTLNVTEFTIEGVTGKFDAGSTATIPGVGTILINSDGSYTFTPAQDWNGTVPTITYTISDGEGGTDTADLDITVTPVNDAPVINGGAQTGTVVEAGHLDDGTVVDGTPIVSGNFTATDVDGDVLTWSVTGTPDTTYGEFTIAADGSWFYELDNDLPATQALKEGDTKDLIFTVQVSDGNGGVKTETVTITITGTNDAPVANADSDTVKESGVSGGGNDAEAGKPTATGNVLTNDTDVDAGEQATLQVSGVEFDGSPGAVGSALSGTYGSLVLNANGTYTYTLDNGSAATQALKQGETKTEVFTYTVTDVNGATSETTLTITVTGTNDRPEITSGAEDAKGSVTEMGTGVAGTPTATGTLTATDVDSDATQTWRIEGGTNGTYGTITIDADGNWTYILDNTREATQKLNNGDVREEIFTARVKDEFGAYRDQLITITVNGSNDKLEGENATVTVTEDVPHEGTLQDYFDDVDDELIVTQFTIEGDPTVYTPGVPVEIKDADNNPIGTVTINADGTYIFTPEPNYAGDVPTITYTMKEDRTGGESIEQTLTFDMVKVADAPGLEADKTVDTMEDVSKALGLKIPTITDTGAGGVVTNDFPERIGEITLTIGGVGADGVTLLNGTDVLTPVDGKITIVLVDGSNQPLDIHVNDVPAEGDGVYYLTEAEYEALQANPKAESGDNFTVTVDVTSYEVDGNGVKIPGVAGASSSQVIDVDVQAVTDGATLAISQTDFTGDEDTAINISDFLTPTLTSTDDNPGNDLDGSETFSYSVSGLPVGSVVTIGDVETTITTDDQIVSSPFTNSVTPPEISIKPPLNFSGDIEGVTITLNTKDTDSDSTGTIETVSDSVTINLYVSPVAGDVAVAGVETLEDTAVAFLAGVTVTDADGSEVINSISFDVPAGWELTTIPTVAGMTVTGGSTGSVTIEFADNMSQEDREAALDQFMIKPPAHKSADAEVDLTIKVTDSKIVNGTLVTDTETITDKSVTIIVDAVAEKVGDDSNGDSHDDVTMSGDHVYNVSGKEDTWFALGTNYTDATNTGGGFAGLGDAGVWTNEDPSEFTYAVLTPELESDEAGIAAGDSAIGTLFRYQVEGGEWVEVMFVGDPVWIPSAYLDSLQVKLPANVSGTLNIGVEAGTVDFDEDITRPTSPPDMNGDRADVDIPGVSVGISGKSDLTVIKFDPVADGVTMALNGRATGLEDTAIPLSITTTSTDPSETFEVTISGIPVGSTITYNGVDLTVTGGTVVIPNFENSKSLTVTPPLHYSGDFTLKASAVSKDGDDTSTPTAERDIHVSVKGVADDAEVNLLETPYTVTEGILDANGNQVVLSDLIHSVTTPDTDGSETLTVRITGLGDDFSIVENGDVKLVFQGEGGTERVWLVSADKLDKVHIKLPPNYSGTVDFKVAGVTTEKDGDSNTRELTDVSFTVTPTPEGVITENATLVEDEITPLNLKIIHQNGDTDEVLGDVYIPVNYQDAGGEFTLYLNGVVLEDANLALSEDGDYYIIPSNQVGGLGAMGDLNLDGDLGDLDFKYEVIDPSSDGSLDPVTKIEDGKLSITATPVTDEIDASINNVTFSNGAVGSTADEVAGDDASPDRVLVTHSGLVTVNLHVDSADTDGSEHLVRVVIEGVPDGVTVVGASEMGGGKWLLIYEGADAKSIGSGGIDVPVEFIVGQGAGNKVSNITMTVQGQDRGNDSSLAAKIEQDSVSWKLDVNLTDGTTFTPPTIDEWTYNGVGGTEDTSFTLNEVIDAGVSTSDNSQSHSYTITITDLPAGSDVTGMTLSFIDGEPVYTATVIVGPGDSSQDALDELMGQISITPPANWNDNHGAFHFDAKLTASVVGGTSVEKDAKADMPITPVTDEAIVTIDVADVAEGQTSVTATITAGEGDGGHGVIVDGKLYVQVTTNGNDGGTVSVGGVVVNKTSVSGIADIDDGDYYVIDIGVDGGTVDITYTAPSGSTLQPGDVTFDATVQVKEKDASNIVTTDTSETADVVIINNGVTVESKDWDGLEPNAADKSQAIQLDGLSVVLNDSDGTESITSIMLGGLPVGFLIYVGDTADDAALAGQASNAGGDGTTNTWILSSDGTLPPYISILPPANWSGTLDDLKLLVQSGENSLSEKFLESFDLGSLTITPVANGISINPTISFGNEGQVIALNINASMADAAVAESTAPDGSTETTTLEITGLGEFAAFYDGEELLENVSYNKATDTYTITGLSQAQLDKLGFVQAAGSIKDQDDDTAGTQISIKAWTVESDGGAESNAVESDMTVSIAPQLATSGDDVLIWTGAAINGRGGIDMVALRYGESVSNVDLAGKLRNIEGIDLSVGGANSITGGLTLADVLKITGKSNGTLTIDGDGDDSVVLSNEWTAGLTTDTGYIEYTSDSGLKLLIDEDIVTSFI